MGQNRGAFGQKLGFAVMCAGTLANVAIYTSVIYGWVSGGDGVLLSLVATLAWVKGSAVHETAKLLQEVDDLRGRVDRLKSDVYRSRFPQNRDGEEADERTTGEPR